MASYAKSQSPDRPAPVNVVFVGAGAVGCFYASRLHHPNHNIYVSLTARSNYDAIARDGVKMQTHSFGDYAFTPADVFPSVTAASATSATTTAATAATAPMSPVNSASPATDRHSAVSTSHQQPGARSWDYIVVTTKALPDRSDDSALIAPLVGPRSCIVLIQNGVGVEAPYRARFPATPIVSAVTVVSAEQVRPGVVVQNRWTRLHLGPYGSEDEDEDEDGQAPLAAEGARRTAALADWWTRLGGIRDVEALDGPGLQAVRWHKLCINAAFNPSAVLSGGRGNAEMAADAGLRAHLRGVMDEIWAAAPRVLGRPFPDTFARPDRILRSTARNAGARPSMLLDWDAGRPLELEVILGNPVRIARRKGVELPRLQSLYALLRSAQEVREREDKKKKEEEEGRVKGKL